MVTWLSPFHQRDLVLSCCPAVHGWVLGARNRGRGTMQYATAAVEALSSIFSTRNVKSFLKGPPAHFDPTVHTMRGWQKKFSQVWLKEGFGAAYNNLRMSTVHRTGGTLMGTDHLGNNYYENREAPYGAHALRPRAKRHRPRRTVDRPAARPEQLDPGAALAGTCAPGRLPPTPPRHARSSPVCTGLLRPHALVRDADPVRRVGH